MCGSGTFLLEAAQIALNIAPGSGRRFAFEKLKNFDAQQWKRLKDEAVARQIPASPQPIFGSDLYGDAVAAARENLAAAGFSEVVSLKQANVLEISAPAASGFSCHQSAVWGAHRRTAAACGVLSQTWRCAEEEIQWLERIYPYRRPASAKINPVNSLTANPFVQRRAGMPLAGIQDGCGRHAQS